MLQQQLKQILENTWFPFVMVMLEIFIIGLILFVTTNFVPHSFDFLKDHNLVSWMVAIVTVKLLRYKSTDTDEQNDESRKPEESNTITMTLDDLLDEVKSEPNLPVRRPINVKNGIYPQIKTEDEESDEPTTRV